MKHCRCCNEPLDPRLNEEGDGSTCSTCLAELSQEQQDELAKDLAQYLFKKWVTP